WRSFLSSVWCFVIFIRLSSPLTAHDYSLIHKRFNDLFDRLLRPVVRHSAGADDLVTATAVILKQLAGVDVGSRIEDVGAHRDGRRVFSLAVVFDLHLDIAVRKERKAQEAIAIRDIFDATEIAVNDVAFHRRPFEQNRSELFLIVENLLAAPRDFGIFHYLF